MKQKFLIGIIILGRAFRLLADDDSDKKEYDTLQTQIFTLEKEGTNAECFSVENTIYFHDWNFSVIDGRIQQVLPDGLLIILHSAEDFRLDSSYWDSTYTGNSIFLVNYPKKKVDGEHVICSAKYVGDYSYISVTGANRTVWKYDCGTQTKPSKELVESTILELKDKLAYSKYGTKLKIQAEAIRLAQAKAKAETEAKQKKAIEAALKSNREAAANGDAFGLLRMGERYRDGDGVEKDLVKAKEFLQKAVGAGSPSAKNELDKLNQK